MQVLAMKAMEKLTITRAVTIQVVEQMTLTNNSIMTQCIIQLAVEVSMKSKQNTNLTVIEREGKREEKEKEKERVSFYVLLDIVPLKQRSVKGTQ